ncbi:MAG TPA: alkaline phosphatase family protein [Xanthobacteraceae bacterium]|nr:alkaline phosphatase family protein [Xanthobacteraceae bacterium]
MFRRRMLVIGLDGFDIGFAEQLMAEGALPNIARLRLCSACFDLDHGLDKYSGLAWEHVSTGLSPSDGGRWSALSFDPATYAVLQEPTSARPFLAELSARTVVFDVPYCDLTQAQRVLGLTHWGSHDPGVSPVSRPAELRGELDRRFGPYPATEWIYGHCWPSAEKARAAGAALTAAVELRSKAARWLLTERLPSWELALIVVSESHSAIEPLWHGVDPLHPLHRIKSSAAAGEALRGVYRAIDGLVGDLRAAFPDATLALFAMHGMGANESDLPAMVLLPELLYRAAFGKSYMRSLPYGGATAEGVPLLGEDDTWEDTMLGAVPKASRPSIAEVGLSAWLSSFKEGQPRWLARSGVEWMPAARYCQFWPRMRAFALPSYYDGRVRINLQGRESRGVVPRHEYDKTCAQIADLIGGCRNLLTGQIAVADIHRPKADPQAVGPSEADMYIIWSSAPVGLSTPAFGKIGPVPYRRTGGHSGRRGFLYLAGDRIASGALGGISSFDVVPTLIELLGERRPSRMSGISAAPRILVPA